MTLKRLGLYTKPIVLVNTRNYFAPLIDLLEHAIAERFMDRRHFDMWQLVDSPEDVPAAIENAPPWSGRARFRGGQIKGEAPGRDRSVELEPRPLSARGNHTRNATPAPSRKSSASARPPWNSAISATMCSPSPRCGRPSRCSRIDTSESNSCPRIFSGSARPPVRHTEAQLAARVVERDVDSAARAG